jgi:hypothetical protein
MAQITGLSRLPEVPEEAIDQLLHPSQFYARPADVARFKLRRDVMISTAKAAQIDSASSGGASRRPRLVGDCAGRCLSKWARVGFFG